MIVVVAKKSHLIRHIDVITCFFNGFFEKQIYIIQPIMFENGIS